MPLSRQPECGLLSSDQGLDFLTLLNLQEEVVGLLEIEEQHAYPMWRHESDRLLMCPFQVTGTFVFFIARFFSHSLQAEPADPHILRLAHYSSRMNTASLTISKVTRRAISCRTELK